MEFVAVGSTYRTLKPSAREQFALLRVMLPLLPALRTVGQTERSLDMLASLASIPEADFAVGVERAFALCERRSDDAWVPAVPADIPSMSGTIEVLSVVLFHNFSAYFAVEEADFQPTHISSNFDPVSMPSGLDWLYRPILRGMCRAESLTDGTLHIEHFAEMNAVIDVADENQKRAHKAAEAAARRG